MEAKISIESDPRILAEAFWEMSDVQQAQFFSELHEVITEDHKTNSAAYGLGEIQWCYNYVLSVNFNKMN